MNAHNYFGRAYRDFYRQWLLPVEQTEAEVDFLLARLKSRAGQVWVDLPCAYGRHLEAIRARRPGLRLIGGDLNAVFLADIHGAWRVCCDMSRVPLADGSAHVVLNLLNSFGYFPAGSDGDRRQLAEMARILKPGGRLVMDLPNRRGLLAIVRREPVIRYATARYEAVEEFRWDAATQTMHNRTRWKWPGGRERAGYALRLYTPSQIRRMLARAGFAIDQAFGDFTGRPFAPADADRLLIFATKVS
ncbi:MAG: class I SAM-dependent methyltransferase [Candidatus Sumerlaeia bacterium]